MKIPSYAPPWWMSPRVLFVLAFFSFGVTASGVISFWKYSRDEIPAKIDFTAKTAFGSAAVLSLLVGYQTLRLNIHQKQIDAAFQFLARYDKEDERKARRKIDALIGRTGKLREYTNDDVPDPRVDGFTICILADPAAEDAAATVLNYFEDLALAMKSGYISEAIIFRSLSPTVIKLINALRPYNRLLS